MDEFTRATQATGDACVAALAAIRDWAAQHLPLSGNHYCQFHSDDGVAAVTYEYGAEGHRFSLTLAFDATSVITNGSPLYWMELRPSLALTMKTYGSSPEEVWKRALEDAAASRGGLDLFSKVTQGGA